MGRRRSVTLWLAILAVVLAGCGGGAPEEEGAAPAGGNQASGDGQAASEGGSATGGAGTEAASAGGGGGEAAEVLAQASAPQDEWAGPTQAPAPLPDATVGIIPCGLAIEGCAREARGAEEAAREIGWEPVVIDGQANPQAIQQGMETLINSGADAIILASVNAQDVGDQIRRAADQGIDVIATFASDPTEAGGIGEVGIDDFQAGRALAAYASQDPGGVVIFTQNESPAVAERADGFKAGLEEFAGDTEIVAEQSVPNSQLGAPQEQIMAGILQRNPAPSIRWVYAGFDFMLTPLVNEISRQGRTEIEGMSFDGNLENLQFIREGRVQSAVIGYPLEWAGWAAIDQLNRSLQDQPLVDQGIAFRLLTEDNLPPEGQPYTGDLDFRAEYRSLWGL